MRPRAKVTTDSLQEDEVREKSISTKMNELDLDDIADTNKHTKFDNYYILDKV